MNFITFFKTKKNKEAIPHTSTCLSSCHNTHLSKIRWGSGQTCLLSNTIYYVHWRRKWHPTPVLLPGKSHGWRSLVGYSPWGRKESDMTERLHSTMYIPSS